MPRTVERFRVVSIKTKLKISEAASIISFSVEKCFHFKNSLISLRVVLETMSNFRYLYKMKFHFNKSIYIY